MPTYFPDDLQRRAELATRRDQIKRTLLILGVWQTWMIDPKTACRHLGLPVKSDQKPEQLHNLLSEFQREVRGQIQLTQSVQLSLELVSIWVSN